VLYCLLPPIRRGGFIFSRGSKNSLVCPSDKSNDKMAVSMEHWWNDMDRGTPKYVLGGKKHFQRHFVHHSCHTECSLHNLQRLSFDLTYNTAFRLERPEC
jgi:hypothetical protein